MVGAGPGEAGVSIGLGAHLVAISGRMVGGGMVGAEPSSHARQERASGSARVSYLTYLCGGRLYG